MKSYITAAAVFSVLLLTVPAIPLISGKTIQIQAEKAVSDKSEPEAETTEQKEKNINNSGYNTMKILDITTGKTEDIPTFDYVVGAVAAEMPATFEPEALKAQAVAAYTYAVRQAKKAEISPDESLCGAYFSNDSSKYQTFFTENQIKQYYGESYEEYIEKIRKSVSEVEGEYLIYEDEPIIAAFHSLSTGKTESAENVWGSDIPYLVSVESEYDSKSPRYTETYEFTENEMKDLLENVFKDAELSENPQNWFSDEKISEAGNVLTIKIGDTEVSGQQVRTALSLRSASFEIEYNGSFTITTKGCGHCVGMSQYGANEMAKAGMNYKEILEHYYKGSKIKN